jgi:lipopolysaccharide transport system permease protein
MNSRAAAAALEENQTRSGPTEFLVELRDIFRYGPLLRNLVSKQLKLKYRGSALGFIWSLLNPLSMVLVYTVVFRFIMRFPVQNYALFLVAGVIHWEFFSSAAGSATGTIIDNRELIRRIRFPRIILPAAMVTFDFIQLLLASVAFLLIYLALGGGLWWGHLLYPIALVLQLMFVLGISALISATTVFLRDLQHLVQIVLRLLFWLTPIIYPLKSAPDWALPLFRANPLASYVLIYQSLLHNKTWPDPISWVLAAVFAVVSLFGGLAVFNYLSPRFAEEV